MSDHNSQFILPCLYAYLVSEEKAAAQQVM